MAELQDHDAGSSREVFGLASVPYVPVEALEVYLNRFDCQVTGVNARLSAPTAADPLDQLKCLTFLQMSNKPPMRLSDHQKPKVPGFTSNVPCKFSSLEEARNCLDHIWNTTVRFFYRFADEMESRGVTSAPSAALVDLHKTQLDRLEAWRTTFDKFLEHEGDNLDLRGLQGTMALRISSVVLETHMDTFHSGEFFLDETVWDRYVPQYIETVSYAKTLLEVSTKLSSDSDKPEFFLDMGVIAPLHNVAARCRDPQIRRQAIALLSSKQRQEGLWVGELTARVAERLMNIEEQGLGIVQCCEDVPDWARISTVDCDWDRQARRVTIHYSRMRSRHEKIRSSFSEVMEW